jgi:hypothetical protein
MRLSLLTALLPLALLTVACSGDDGPPLGGDVEGSWRQIPNATDDDPPPPVADRDVITFHADGTMAMVSPDGTQSGTYTVSGGELTLVQVDGTTTHTTTLPYRATDTTFVFGALVPAGETDGLVGAWTGQSIADGVTRSIDLTLRADMTATYAAIGGEEPINYTGTWRAIGDDLEILVMPDPNLTIHMRARLVDGVLGAPYEKI